MIGNPLNRLAKNTRRLNMMTMQPSLAHFLGSINLLVMTSFVSKHLGFCTNGAMERNHKRWQASATCLDYHCMLQQFV
jgi:hypothetical protein